MISSVPITAGGVPIGIADLAFQPLTNVLYGVSTDVGGTAPGQLYTINKSNGVATAIGAPTAFFTSIAFAPNGTLYESAADLNFSNGETVNPRLAVLNPATGAVLSSVTTSAFYGALGVRPTDTAVFAGTGDQGNLYILNPNTGAQALVGNTGLNFVGDLDFAPVPEPGTWALAALGLLGILAVRKAMSRHVA